MPAFRAHLRLLSRKLIVIVLSRALLFASCSPKVRYYQSVVIAIPGWNGTCKGTFGEGRGNLLNVMRKSNFFDIDCFDYDSHHTALADSRRKLRERIVALQNAGYREFAFVTHSTGGILALDLLLSEALREDGQLRDQTNRSLLFKSEGARLRALYTWAVPLNGVRDTINWLGKAASLRWSPAVLPLLAADSEYLKQLKERLGGFDARYAAASNADRSDYGFAWVILQGQDDDGVVRNILNNEAWFPKSIRSSIVHTASGHSYNVAESGEVGAPLYPGEMMSDKAKLALTLYPRIDEYFTAKAAGTVDLGQQQRMVLAGVLDYAANSTLFEHSYLPVSKFIIVLLKGRFPRDSSFDDEAVAGFASLLEQKIRSQDYANAVDFADRLLNDIEFGLQLDMASQPDQFGGGTVLSLCDVSRSWLKKSSASQLIWYERIKNSNAI